MRFTEINVTMDVCAGVVVVFLLVYILTQPKPRRRADTMFMLICLCNLAMLVGDIPNWLCEGFARPWYPAALHSGIFLQFLGGALAMPLYTLYVKAHLEPKVRMHRGIVAAILFIGGVSLACLAANFFNGMFYYIDSENVYHRGSLWLLSQGFTVSIMLIDICAELHYRRHMRAKDIAVFQIYKIFPVLAIVFQSKFYGVAPTYAAVTLSLLLIFLNIQSEQRLLLEQQERRLTQSRVAIMLSQIQPHFLYNALDGIGALCAIDPTRAEHAITEFSMFLRGNIDSLGAAGLISFERELGHTKHYLRLEQMRFDERLQVVYDTPAMDFRLPALTLQPIVENAVRYGVTAREKGGVITISTRETEGAYLLTVKDDGVGYDDTKPATDERSHVGIENVRDRLQTQCGGDLVVVSTPGVGTVATITIPKGQKML